MLVFLIFFATPGVDPASRIAGRNADPETLERCGTTSASTGRCRPVRDHDEEAVLEPRPDLVRQSRRQGDPADPDAAPVTLSLVLGAAIIWVVVAIAMGLAAAVMRGTFLDPGLMILGLIGISMPVFWLGEVVNLVTQSRLHAELFSGCRRSATRRSRGPVALVQAPGLPWFTLSVLYIGFYGRVLRSSLIEAQNEDYVRTARAKGMSERRVLLRHVLRTSLITFVSLFGLDFGALVGGGALLTEVVFGLPGVGKLTYDSLQNLDLPVIMATVMYASFFVVAGERARRHRLWHARPACARLATRRSWEVARPHGLVPHRERARARGRRRLLQRRARRDRSASSASRARARAYRDVARAADRRSERGDRGRGDLQGPRPPQARAARDARHPRPRDRDDLPGTR